MIRSRMFMVLSVAAALIVALAASTGCNKGGGCILGHCLPGLHCCEDDICHDCCYSADCPPDHECDLNRECVPRTTPPELEPEEEEQPPTPPESEPEGETSTEPESEPEAETANPAVPPTPTPLPELEPVLPFILGEFEEDYNDAFASSDVESVVDLLHPVVVDLYGPAACSSYIQEVIVNPVQIEIVDAIEVGDWTWEIDERSIPVENAFEVDVNFTVQGETTRQVIHLALREDGKLGWFTKCGEPLPTAPEQEPRVEPAPPLVLTAPEGVGRNCETGELTGAPEPWVNPIAVEATADTVSWQMGQIGQFPIAVGMQGYIPGYPLIEVSPWDWYFDTRGHFNLGGMCESLDQCSGSLGVVVGGREGDWTVVPGVQPAVWIEDDKLWMDVQWDQMVQELLPYYPVDDPSTITIMFTVTDGNECAVVGEGADGLPTLLLIELPFIEQP
jgi:hypothetical protein